MCAASAPHTKFPPMLSGDGAWNFPEHISQLPQAWQLEFHPTVQKTLDIWEGHISDISKLQSANPITVHNFPPVQ